MKGTITLILLLTLIFCFTLNVEAHPDGWISPTSHDDPDNDWVTEEAIYDESLTYYGKTTIAPSTWCGYVILNRAAFYCSKIRLYVDWSLADPVTVDIDVYDVNASDWVDVFEGDVALNMWIEKNLTTITYVDKARVRFYNDFIWDVDVYFKEFDFYETSVGFDLNWILARRIPLLFFSVMVVGAIAFVVWHRKTL